MPRNQFVEWCPLDTVYTSGRSTYEFISDIDYEQISSTIRFVDQRIRMQELALQQAERAADNAHRRANVNKGRQNAKLFSFTRSMQHMRYTSSKLASSLSELPVRNLVADIQGLSDLKFRLEEELRHSRPKKQAIVSHQTQKPRERRFCTQCGSPVVSGDAFCGNCGRPLT